MGLLHQHADSQFFALERRTRSSYETKRAAQGNSIYLGLGLAAPDEGDRWIRSIISIVAFALGSFFFARYHRFFGGRKRWVMASSFLIQSCFVAAAALVVTVGPELDVSDSFTFWVGIPIALIAFQSGGQAVISRVLEMGSLSSVVVTAVLCDLFSDQHLFAARNVDRNRRLAAPLLLILGAYGGGMWARSSIGILGSLWTVVVLKGMLAVVWMLWSAEKEEEA